MEAAALTHLDQAFFFSAFFQLQEGQTPKIINEDVFSSENPANKHC